jgi:3-oxoacyl-[acyl-carrier-protein] synthase-1
MTLPVLAEVVAVGARTPIGLDACQTGMLFRAGFASMSYAPLAPEGGDITICQQSAIAADCVGRERLATLAVPALDEVLAQLADIDRGASVQLLLALDPIDEARAQDAEAVAGALHAACQRRFPSATLELVARGEAGPCVALPKALAALASGEVQLIIMGGVHSDYDPTIIARLIAGERLYDDNNLDAVIPGESAAFVALTSPAFASRQKLQPMARLCGSASGMEAARFDNDVPASLARGTTATLRQATQALEESGERAGWVLSDLGFEAWRMREWQSAFVRITNVLGAPYRIDCPAQRIGTMGAAALPLFVTLAAEAFRGGYAPSPLALAFAGSEAGERGALLLSAPAR